MEAILFDYILKAIFAAIPAVGFGMLFNVPKNTLAFCAFGGAFSYTCRALLMDMGISIEIATFIASLLIGMIALRWSRKYLIPRPVYTVASIIPLIPGTYAFAAMIALVDMNSHGVTFEDTAMFIENALKALSILGAISFGLALPSLYYMRYNRPII